ncbi:glycosyltransferase [Paenibacillus harenae]|nr:glycosyltransferase [Paenibacillus harenae]
MKKNLLFVMPSLSSGGGERSLITLLSQIDYDSYDVDLYLLKHEGLFMDLIPKEVNVLPLPEQYHLFMLPMLSSIQRLVFKGKLPLAYNRMMFSLKNRYAQNESIREQYNWRYLARFLEPIAKQYDTAIGFLEKTSTYFCVEKVKADKKIGWIHIDYDKLGMDPNFDKHYFDQLDYIVTVSEECSSILKKRFPEQVHKINVIHNIVSPSMIERMAEKEQDDLFGRKGEEVVILSIGRLHHQKAFELAIEACSKLVDRGYKIQWNIIGDGDEKQRLTALIQSHGLTEYFRLLGLKSNPYPYIKQADIYVQTSKFEGKSIAIDEAKILNKPIVITRFSTAKDQINDGVDGLIVDMDGQSIAAGIERLIKDIELRNKMVDELSQVDLGTEDEIHKLYSLIE